jgi:hypothetical protein
MKKLSIFDCKFLGLCRIIADERRFTDTLMLRAMGVAPLDGSTSSSDGISRLLQIYTRDGLWPEGVMEEREAELRESCFARFMQNCQETNIENLLAQYEQQIAHEAEIQACADRIAQHTAPGIPEDDTVRWLRRAGVPVTAENWMQLQFMGNPPQRPLDGELLASLPDWVRQEYHPEEAESTEPVCGLEDEDPDDICDAPSAGWCGEPSHTPVDPDEDDEED